MIQSTSSVFRKQAVLFSIVVERLTGASWYGRSSTTLPMMSMLVRSVIGSAGNHSPHACAGDISRVADESHVQRIARNAVGVRVTMGKLARPGSCSCASTAQAARHSQQEIDDCCGPEMASHRGLLRTAHLTLLVFAQKQRASDGGIVRRRRR